MSTNLGTDVEWEPARVRRIDTTAAATMVVALVFCGLVTAKVHAVATGASPRQVAHVPATRGALLGDIQGDRLVDGDRDGVPDALRVLVGVRVDRPGRYQFAASLTAPGGVAVTSDPWDGPLARGARTMAVDFRLDGPRRLGVGGPFRIVDGVLTRGDDPKLVEQRRFVGVTTAVSLSASGRWPVTMPQPQPAARDDDGDGRSDRLSWLLQPDVPAAGEYLVEGVLVDPSGHETPSSRLARLNLPGSQILSLDFPGSAIRLGGPGVYNLGRVRITQVGGDASFVTGVRGHTAPIDLDRWEPGGTGE